MEHEAVETPEVTPELESPPTEDVAPEQPTEDAETPEAATEEEEAPAENVPTEKPTSPRFEKRIRQLSGKLAEAKAQLTPQYAPQLPAVPAPPSVSAPPIPSGYDLPPGDYTPEQLKGWAMQTGETLSDIKVNALRAELAQERAVQRVEATYNQDLHRIETQYAELNEDSPKYDSQLTHTVTELYEDALLANPSSASLAKIADRVMSLQRRTAAQSGAQAARAVAGQRSSGALAATAGSPKGTATKWTPEKVAALSTDEYVKNEPAIKRDLYGL